MSVSSPPTETSSSGTMSTSINTLPGTFCACMATCLIHHTLWMRRLHPGCAPHFTTLSSTCWTQRQRRRSPLNPTGGKCTACATPASYRKGFFASRAVVWRSSPLCCFWKCGGFIDLRRNYYSTNTQITRGFLRGCF